MTQSQLEVICFDEVVKQYPLIKKGFTLSSVDALFFRKEEIFLIEFKNGCLIPKNPCDFGYQCDLLADTTDLSIVKNIKKKGVLREKNFRNELLKKFYETVFALMYLDEKFSFEYFKNNATLILVYNQDKNNAIDQIYKSVSRGKNIQKFGLGYLENYCCKNVYTQTKDEFDEFLRKNFE